MKRLPNLLKSEIEKESHLQFRLNQQDLLFHFILTKDFRPWSDFSNCSPPIGALEIIRKRLSVYKIPIKVIKGHSRSINHIFYSSIVVPHHVLIPKPKRHIFPQSHHLYLLLRDLYINFYVPLTKINYSYYHSYLCII